MKKSCCVAGCDKPYYAKSCCEMHYQRLKKYGDPLGGEQNHAPADERFRRFYCKGGPDECWEWHGKSRTSGGYGRFQPGGRSSPHVLAHRYAFELATGLIPYGKIVMHTCDNQICVNPAHLRLGTHKENTQDMIKKGRHARVAPVGNENGKAVLTPDLVRYIRSVPSMSHAALAREIGCAVSTVRGVRSGRVWNHIS